METSYEGGIGGKIRRRPFRRPSTPYDRPPTALTNPNNGNQRSWISKLVVDPASRIISGSAKRLFSSVFSKRLPAPPPLPEVNLEPITEVGGEVCTSPSGAQEQGNGERENQKQSFESCGINEIEQLLKQKTFTRVEFERLTELLRSRIVNLPEDDENKTTEPSTSQLVATQVRDEQIIPAQENRVESRISTPTGGLHVLEEEAASPADLAKAYMESRSSTLLPTSLGFRSQIFREDPPSLNIVPFAPKSPNMLHTPRSSRRFSGVPQLSENHYMTPRPLGRSALYSIARSPSTKTHSKATHKGAEPSDNAYAGSLISQWRRVDKTLSGGKQVLKRTRSVLDNDFGSVGPIRKIRQKSGLMSPSMYNVPGSPFPNSQTPVGSYSVQGSISTVQKPLSLDGPKHSIAKVQAAENRDNKLSTASSAFVPNQSSEIAMKIMQQLDKLVPSPKEKLSESRETIAPNKSNIIMSNGEPFKTTENEQSPRLQYALSGTSDGLSETQLPASGNSIGKQERVEVNGPVKTVDMAIKSSAADIVENMVKGSDATPVKSMTLGFTTNLPRKETALQMSAPWDSVGLNNNSCSSKITFTPHAAEKVEKPVASSSQQQPAVTANKDADTILGSADCSIVPKIDAGFASTITSAADTVKPPPPMPDLHSSSLFNKSTPKEQLFKTTFGSKSTEKGPLLTFCPTSSSTNGTSGTIFVDSKTEIFNSTATKDMKPSEATGSDKNEKNLKGEVPKKSSENAITSISMSATPKIFSFGASTDSSLSNGSLTTFPSFSVSAAQEAPIFGSSASSTISSSIADTSGCCSSSSPISNAAPVFSASSALKFGSANSSAPTSTAYVSPPVSSSSLVSADLEMKKKQASLPSCTTGSSILALTSTSTHTGSSIFSFGASVSDGCTTSSFSASNLSQSSTFGTASRITPFTQSMQSQFGSSSSATFGLSGTSFGSASSPFGSSSSSAKLFGSGSGTGLSSSVSSSAGTDSYGSDTVFSFAPAHVTASSSFSSSLQPSTSSIFGSGFGSTSSAAGFVFGASAAASGSTLPTFGSPLGTSSGSSISFTSAAATAAASNSLSQAQPVFGSGSASLGNDQMNVEDSMAVDKVHTSAPVTPAFGQLAGPSSSSSFSLGSAAAPTSGPSVFQFGGHQNTATPQSPSTFPGGSFSLGSGATDKSNRRLVKIKRDKHRKK